MPAPHGAGTKGAALRHPGRSWLRGAESNRDSLAYEASGLARAPHPRLIGAASTESNLRHLPYRGSALPTELWRRGGSGGTRTRDILLAGQALYQLSYTPVNGPHRWLRSTGLLLPKQALYLTELCAECVSRCPHVLWEPVMGMRVQVRANLMWGNNPSSRTGNANHLVRWYLALSLRPLVDEYRQVSGPAR